MRKILVFTFVVLSFNQAEAQVRLIGVAKGGESVSSLLARAGCNPLWSDKAMKDSGIKGSEVDKLPRGRRVILKAEKCEPAPPAKVALVQEKPVDQEHPKEDSFGWLEFGAGLAVGLLLGLLFFRRTLSSSASSRMTSGTSPGLGGQKTP